MSTVKKLLCMGLAAAFVLAALASCANNEEEPKNTETGTIGVEGADDVPIFEEADFEEKDFKILHYGDLATDFHDQYIWAEDYTGAVISDAVFERNSLVEDKYNVKVLAEECNTPMSVALNRMKAGQCDFELIYEWGIRSKAAALDGQLLDFYELDYVNFDNSYWIPNAVEGHTVADRMFVATNMITMNGISWAGFLFYNKRIYEKLNFEAEPYDYVYANNWTYDVIIPMSLAADEDLNGDGEITIEDQSGGMEGMEMLAALCSDTLLQENDDGTYTVIPYTEKMIAQYNKYKNTLLNVDALDAGDVWGAGIDLSMFPSIYVGARNVLFAQDHVLFTGGNMDFTKEFVDMQSDYGIVPNPSVEPGGEYSSGIDYCAPMFSIPLQVEDIDMVGIVLEYMAYESERLLLPAYYETTIKTKRMQDTRDYEMLEIIRDGIDYGWTGIYMWDATIATIRSEMLSSGNFASVGKRLGNKCQSEVDEIVEMIALID